MHIQGDQKVYVYMYTNSLVIKIVTITNVYVSEVTPAFVFF
jgi:hypothetical protein